jgi:hypothetical protein
MDGRSWSGYGKRMPLDPFGLRRRRFLQIIAATGGGQRESGRARARELLSCSFCGEHQTQVGNLIAGPGHYICHGCVDRAQTALATPGTRASGPEATMWRASDTVQDEGCSFCGKSHQVEAMAAAERGRICNECLDLCQDIIAYNSA